MKAIRIDTDGTVRRIEVNGYEDFVEHVGGYLEAVRVNATATAYIDEEGKLKGLPHNEVASELLNYLKAGLAATDFISGPMVIVGKPDAEGVDTDVPPEVVWAARRSHERLREVRVALGVEERHKILMYLVKHGSNKKDVEELLYKFYHLHLTDEGPLKGASIARKAEALVTLGAKYDWDEAEFLHEDVTKPPISSVYDDDLDDPIGLFGPSRY